MYILGWSLFVLLCNRATHTLPKQENRVEEIFTEFRVLLACLILDCAELKGRSPWQTSYCFVFRLMSCLVMFSVPCSEELFLHATVWLQCRLLGSRWWSHCELQNIRYDPKRSESDSRGSELVVYMAGHLQTLPKPTWRGREALWSMGTYTYREDLSHHYMPS